MSEHGPRMVKFGVAAVLLGLYTAISAWIVAGAGESYRSSLVARAAPATSPTADRLPDPVAIPRPEELLVKIPDPAPAPAPSPPPVVAVTPKPDTAPAKGPPAVVEKKAPEPRPIDPFWNEPDQSKIWDFDKMTLQDERDLGQALHRMVLRDHPEVDGGPLLKRVEDAAKPYLPMRSRKDLDYTFTVLDCPRMNAFSHPGGYIYICKGLFDWIAEDEDYALGFILAHEIAHVDLGHAIYCMRDPDIKKNFKFGTSLFFYAAMIPGGYLKQQDAEADRWAVERMMRTGKTRYETLAFLRRLEDYAKSNGFENKRKAPNDKPEVPILDNHIRAHPIPRSRLEDAKALIDRLLKI